MAQDRPGAVIQAPFGGFDGLSVQELRGRASVERCAGRGILDAVKFFREAGEVVDGFEPLACLHHDAGREPVSGNDENRARKLGEIPAHLGERSRERIVLDRIGRAAVADENRRHSWAGGKLTEDVFQILGTRGHSIHDDTEELRESFSRGFEVPWDMVALDWSQRSAVESVPGRLNGAWVFRDTRMPVSAVFQNFEAGATVTEIAQWFDISTGQIIEVLEFAAPG
jgi:uncharacterized protein (DUF433 family)